MLAQQRYFLPFLGFFLLSSELSRVSRAQKQQQEQEYKKHPIRQELVDAANTNPSSGWVAEEVEKNLFANRSLEEIKGLMGLLDYGTRLSTHTNPDEEEERQRTS